jgi:PhnB protein
MRPTFSLSFAGNCAAAFRFYERCLPAKLLFELTWGDSPLAGQAPAEWRAKICHATLAVGTLTLHGADALPGAYEAPKGFSIVLDVEELGEADRLFGALSEKGRLDVPLQETFWARRYGKVVDQFGIAWEINGGSSPEPN